MAELNIGRNDGHFGNGDYKDDADNTEESEHIIISTLILPQALEDEQQFDEQDGEGNQSRNQDTMIVLEIPRLWRYLPWDRVGLCWVLPCIGSEIPIPASSIDQRQLNQKPESH